MAARSVTGIGKGSAEGRIRGFEPLLKVKSANGVPFVDKDLNLTRSISDLVDTEATNGDVLSYDGTLKKWVAVAASSSSSLNGLADVDATNVVNGNVLTYNSASSKWEVGTNSRKLILRNQTTNATPTELFLDGSSLRAVLTNNSAWSFAIKAVARNTTANENVTWHIDGSIVRNTNAAGTALFGSQNVHKNNTTNGNEATWVLNVDADTTNGSLRFLATGESGHIINWIAVVETAEVTT